MYKYISYQPAATVQRVCSEKLGFPLVSQHHSTISSLSFILTFRYANPVFSSALLYIYKAGHYVNIKQGDLLRNFLSYQIQIGDLPVTGLPLSPPGCCAAVRHRNTETVGFLIFFYLLEILKTFPLLTSGIDLIVTRYFYSSPTI